jgi:hypothetical protein
MTDLKRSLVVAHHHPGRLRLRARALEEDPQLRDHAVEALADVDGVTSARGSAIGSVLVEYDPRRVDAGTLLSTVVAATSLAIAPPPSPDMPARIVALAAQRLDEHVAEWSGGRFDMRIAVPAALAAASFASLLWSDHRRAPRWDNLLYWSFTLFRALNDSRLDEDGGRGERGRADGVS